MSKLSKLRPVTVVFEFVSEREPRLLAEQINAALSFLNWKSFRHKGPLPEDFFADGVTISPGRLEYVGPPDKQLQQEYEINFRNTAKAALILKDELVKNGVEAVIELRDYLLPATMLHIRIGLKTNHFLEATLKELGPERLQPLALPTGTGGSITVSNVRLAIVEATTDAEKILSSISTNLGYVFLPS